MFKKRELTPTDWYGTPQGPVAVFDEPPRKLIGRTVRIDQRPYKVLAEAAGGLLLRYLGGPFNTDRRGVFHAEAVYNSDHGVQTRRFTADTKREVLRQAGEAVRCVHRVFGMRGDVITDTHGNPIGHIRTWEQG